MQGRFERSAYESPEQLVAKRLWECESLRTYLRANVDDRTR